MNCDPFFFLKLINEIMVVNMLKITGHLGSMTQFSCKGWIW